MSEFVQAIKVRISFSRIREWRFKANVAIDLLVAARVGGLGPANLLDACRKILYKRLDSADILELLGTSLANLPSDYSGFNQYWQSTSTQSDR
jgi:hypothetical protein